MAYKDGMIAISKVLNALAILGALCALGIAVAGGIFGTGGASIFFTFVVIAVVLFFLFWTPAWVIKKFVQ
jgi:hypothetical protein